MSTKTLVFDRLKRLSGNAALSKTLANSFKLISSGKTKRYNNMKIEYQGIVYDSLSEAYYGYILYDMLNKGEIKDVQRQIKFPLLNMYGKKTMRYVADFIVTSNSDKEYVIDVKGYLTTDNKIKYAYFRYVYEKEIVLVRTTGKDKFTTSFLI